MISQSESVAALSKALVAFHREVGKVGKDSANPFFKSKYASLENILDAIAGPLQASGLAVVQFPSGDGLATRIVHESGEWMGSECSMSVKEANNPQAAGSAITYYRRYAIAAALCLNIGDDDDGNAASSVTTSPLTGSGNDFGRDPAPEGPKVQRMEVTVASIERLESKAGKPYAKVTTPGGKVITAFKNTMDQLEEGGQYTCEVEVGEYMGKPQLTIIRVVGSIPGPEKS